MARQLVSGGALASLLMFFTASATFAAGEELAQLAPGFKFAPAMVMIVFMLIYLAVGFWSKVTTSAGYWVAGRGIGSLGNGAAMASDWISAVSFMGIAGLLYLNGWFALSFIIGGMGGYVLLLCLVATQIRRFGKYTIPEFLGDRFDSHGVRLIAAAVTVVITVIYAIAQFKGIGLIAGWVFGMSYGASVFFGAGIVLGYLLVSGMAGVTRNQQIQYAVVISAFLIPLWILAKKAGGHGILPALEYGSVISGLMEGKAATGSLSAVETAKAADAYLPWGAGNLYHFIAVAFTFMAGTVGLPHILIRFYTVKNENIARKSVVWGIFFIGMFYWFSPAYAAFGKFLNPLGGAAVADVIILSAAERAGMGLTTIGYLAAGALAASLSTAAGLLLTGASAVAHDWYATVFRPNSNERQTLLVGRIFTAVLCLIVVLFALQPPAMIAQVALMAFAIAACTMTPAIVLGIWYSKANKYGAFASMSFGLLASLLCVFGWVAKVPLFSEMGLLPATSSALILCPLAFLINIVVSRMTTEKVSAETLKKSNAILRKLHNLPGQVEAAPQKAKVYSH